MTVHDMDVMAELPGMDLQRVTATPAHAPAAGNWLRQMRIAIEKLYWGRQYHQTRKWLEHIRRPQVIGSI